MLSKANSTGRPGSGQPCPGGMLHACLAQLTPKWVFLKHLPEQWGRPVWAQRAREVTAELTAHNCLRCPACAMRCGSQCTHLASTPAGILLPPLTSANSCSSPVQGTICPIQMQSHPTPQPPTRASVFTITAVLQNFISLGKMLPIFYQNLNSLILTCKEYTQIQARPQDFSQLLGTVLAPFCNTHTDMRMNNMVLSHSTACSIVGDISQGASRSTYPKETTLSPQTCECHWHGKRKAQGQCRNCLLCHQMPNCCQVPD